MRHPFLVGKRVYLRRIERADLEGPYFQWLNDAEVTRFMQTGMFPNSAESMEAYYKATAQSQTEAVFAIALVENDKHVGNIGLHRIHQVFRSAEIGILVGEKEVWGQGIGTEAISLIVPWAFERLNLHRLFAGAAVQNIGSIRAFEKAGFAREGVSRQAYFLEGQYVDCVHLSLLRHEWLSAKKGQ